MWSRWQPDRGVDFNSWLVEGPAGAFVVDPLEPPDASVLARCREANVRAIVITNRDHERAAAMFARELGAAVIASEADAPQLTLAVDRTVAGGDDIFGWTVIALEGFKTPGEMVLHSAERHAAISGDAFWGAPAGALRLMPDEKLADPARALLSARRVRALRLDHLLVGDGLPVFGNAHAGFGAMLDARAGDAAIGTVNIDGDEVPWRRYPGDPAPFRGALAEIGLLLGAERLGIALGRLDPGESYCPLHWHTREEEFFVVWDGTPTLRTPAATRQMRRGDCALFQTNPSGAHRLSNESSQSCTILMIANVDAGDACYYPDSKKVLIETTGKLVRSEPEVGYFEGE
ncbi:MAG: hypothetical protein NVS3B28_08210 [Candidatus Velthaea sp.]